MRNSSISRRCFNLSALAALLGWACESQTTTTTTPIAESTAPVTPPANGSSETAVSASNAFSADLFAHMPAGNFAYSPASLSLALSMTYAGARGDTALQMAKVLHLPSGDALHASWTTSIAGWQKKTDGYEIATANRLFGEASYRFEPAFVTLTKDKYGAPLEPCDFVGAPGEQRTRINRWVEERTRERIKDLLPGRAIDKDTRLVLVNALYLRATWKDGFDTNSTAPADFHVDAEKQVKVSMMRRSGGYKFARVDQNKIIELPYRGDRLSMVAVLPDDKNGLAALEKDVTQAKLDKWIGALAQDYITVFFPKFTIAPAEPIDLSAALKSMGMTTAFDRKKADFSGIANPPNPEDRLYIGNVFHKAFVAVDEQGTEAAAASAVTMPKAGGAPGEDRTFKADHPFLFFIRDVTTGAILFVGRVTDPTV